MTLKDAGKNMYGNQFKHFFRDLLQIAEKYAKAIEATDRNCDSLIAKYANEKQALAVVFSDTDYLIYEVSWQYWRS